MKCMFFIKIFLICIQLKYIQRNLSDVEETTFLVTKLDKGIISRGGELQG